MSLLNIMLVDKCNLKCPMCGHVKNSTGKQMTLAQYESILRQAKFLHEEMADKITHIRLDGNREALLHPDFQTLVEITKDYGFSMSIITNGVLLTPEKSNVIVENIATINISVTGITAEIFYNFQGSHLKNCIALLNRVKENVRYLVQRRDDMHSKLQIHVSYIATHDSVREIKEAVFFWKKVGVDKIGIFSDTNEIVGKLKKTPQSSIAYYPCPGGMCSGAPVISTSGEVFPCCQPPGEYMSLGNCFKTDLRYIFSSDKYFRFYKTLSELNPNTLPSGCRTCGVIAQIK